MTAAAPPRPPRRLEAWVLTLAALAAMALVLRNGLVSDDLFLLRDNPAVHRWSGLWTGFVAPYWPPPSVDGLYRPLATSTFTLQWMLGGGAAPVMHAVSLLLYLVAVFATWRFLARLVSAEAALLGAVLFAIHPVHVEAVALVVNQGELLVGALAAWTAGMMIDAERGLLSEDALLRRVFPSLVVAIGMKEHGVMLPLLLAVVIAGAAEDPLRRLRARASLLGGLLLVAALFWMARSEVLGGLTGAAPALGLPATVPARAVAMLGVVPTWARLLLWPAHLQADYGPRELPPFNADLLAPWLGAALLLGWGIALVLTWRRSPAARVGLLWLPVALAPVSNVILPTGTWVGERTLFLPSVGVVLLAGLTFDAMRARGARRVALALTTLIATLGALRAARRMGDWADLPSQVIAMVRDAPDGYRAHLAAGTWAFDSLGDPRTAELHLRTAITLWPDSPEAYQALADRFRSDGFCAPAIPLYGVAVDRWPGRNDIRASLIACLYAVGAWAEAARHARAAPASAEQVEWFRAAAARADSAAVAHLPPGALPPPSALYDLTRIGRGR